MTKREIIDVLISWIESDVDRLNYLSEVDIFGEDVDLVTWKSDLDEISGTLRTKIAALRYNHDQKD